MNAKLPIVQNTNDPNCQTNQTIKSQRVGRDQRSPIPQQQQQQPQLSLSGYKQSDSKNKEIKTFILMILRVPKKTQPTGRSRVLFRSRPHVRLLQRSIKIGREPSRKTGQETEKRKNNKKQHKIKIKRKFKQKQKKMCIGTTVVVVATTIKNFLSLTSSYKKKAKHFFKHLY